MARRLKENKTPHFVVVTGGVLSGNGKGITAASIGACMSARGLSVNIQKFDMYLNVDAGTLKPGKHGEVFVTIDGAETDLDLGHYERFLDRKLDQSSSVMQGRVLKEIIEKERSGGFKGHDVQVIPHVTDAIGQKMMDAAKGFDVHIIELGGTVGDYEGLAFVEAARRLALSVGKDNVTYVHVVYLPYLEVSGEIKTKPAQNAAKTLRSIGITPHILAARCERDIESNTKFKLSVFTDIPEDNIAILQNARTVYEVPLTLEKQGITRTIANRIGTKKQPDMSIWRKTVTSATKEYAANVHVAMIAKYLDNLDTYMSVTEGLKAAAWANKVNLQISWVNAEDLESMSASEASLELMKYDGILVPGGFGQRGVEGMIIAAQHARQHKTPYFGICLGMQVATIAFARDHGCSGAHSTEFDAKSQHPVITTMEGQQGKEMTGGTMRLGSYTCDLQKGSLASTHYQARQVQERHRHRYEFNPDYRDRLEASGLVLSGTCPDNGLVEIIELAPNDHPFYIGVQFHPEFGSRPYRPHPIFDGFIKAAKKHNKNK